MSSKDDLDPSPVLEVLNEAAGIAEGIAVEWRRHLKVPIRNEDGGFYMNLWETRRAHMENSSEPARNMDGAPFKRGDGTTVFKTVAVYEETREEVDERAFNRLLTILRPQEVRSPRGLRRWLLPNRNFFFGVFQMVSVNDMIRLYRDSLTPAWCCPIEKSEGLPHFLFRHGPTKAEEIAELNRSLLNAGQLAGHMLAIGGKAPDEQEEILRRWVRDHNPREGLRHSEVMRIVMDIRNVDSLPPNCGEPGAFLKRFCRKGGKRGSHAPWYLTDAAREREL